MKLRTIIKISYLLKESFLFLSNLTAPRSNCSGHLTFRLPVTGSKNFEPGFLNAKLDKSRFFFVGLKQFIVIYLKIQLAQNKLSYSSSSSFAALSIWIRLFIGVVNIRDRVLYQLLAVWFRRHISWCHIFVVFLSINIIYLNSYIRKKIISNKIIY